MVGTTQYGCVNSAAIECQVTLNNVNQPTVTAFAKTSDTQITFTGTNFPTVGSPTAYFKRLQTLSVTVNAAGTEAVATWSEGVPTSETEVKPGLGFMTASDIINIAINDPSATAFTNPLGTPTSTTGLECSFAGGCSYEITGPGVTSSLKAPQTDIAKNRVEVCGKECVLDVANSDATKASCKVPAMPTQYSANNL